MGKILIDAEGNPATPAAGKARLLVNTTSKRLTCIDDTGRAATVEGLFNSSTANQTGFTSDTYLTGSSISIPPALLRVGTTYYCAFDMAKTGGTGAPTPIIRFGTNGTTADTARLTFTFGAGTAVADTGIFEVWAHVRTSGASGVMVGMCRCTHHLAATGLTNTGASGTGIILVTSGSFDMTVASSIIGISFNGGASFGGTNTVVQTRLTNC